MKQFKFFQGQNSLERTFTFGVSPNVRRYYHGATWEWADEYCLPEPPENQCWRIETVRVHGIMDFLNDFPDGYSVPVISITGNGFRHTIRTCYDAWGFDIEREFIWISYFRLRQKSRKPRFWLRIVNWWHKLNKREKVEFMVAVPIWIIFIVVFIKYIILGLIK